SQAALSQRDASARLQAMQLAFGLIERELAQALPVTVRGGSGVTALTGGVQSIEFSTLGEAGWQPEAVIRGVRYWLNGDRLLRASGTTPATSTTNDGLDVLDDLADLRFSYYARPGGWQPGWQASASAPLPAAVRIELETKAGERFERIVELPGDRP
ncbi:MAG: type II secretion system protein GspJ, partial [Xanthomonadales bacterium]|nr:type II secretion system protein GspJ [Xanthomonadales bacterium]